MSGADMGQFAAAASEVDGAWPQFVALWEQFRVRYGLRLRADLGDTDQSDFITQALGAAYAKGRLLDLVTLLNDNQLVAPGFAGAISPFCAGTYRLQSVVNGAWRVQSLDKGLKWLIHARESVCRINVDGRHRGTGVLIAPNLVATAAHVVESLVDAAGQAMEGSLARLAIQFSPDNDDNQPDEGGPRTTPIVAQLHSNWLQYYSAPAPQEHRGLSITSLQGIQANGPWDLAVIRLSRAPAIGMTGYTRLGKDLDKPSFGIHVIHHPANDMQEATQMLWSVGQVRQALGDAPPLRLLHDASTSGGSSGAPCFDGDGKLVALHQAGPTGIYQPDQNNRAVPIHAWASLVDGWASAAVDVPYLSYVEDTQGRRAPVIGRRGLQQALWLAMNSTAPGAPRVFVILGDRGLGQTFSVTIARALARLANQSVVAIDMRNAEADDAAAFAQRVAGALAADIPGELVAASGLTSALRDLTNDVAPALRSSLAALATGRKIWLALNGWDEAAFPPSHPARVLVELLLTGIDQTPGLQMILTGWTSTVGAGYLEMLEQPTSDDIADHVLATLFPPGETPSEAVGQLVNNLVGMMLQQEPTGKPYARAVAVAERVRLMAGGAPAPAIGVGG